MSIHCHLDSHDKSIPFANRAHLAIHVSDEDHLVFRMTRNQVNGKRLYIEFLASEDEIAQINFMTANWLRTFKERTNE